MQQLDKDKLIDLLIDFFETGNNESDNLAKLVFEYSADFKSDWQEEIERIQKSSDWTGIRSVQAEMLVHALKHCRTTQNEE